MSAFDDPNKDHIGQAIKDYLSETDLPFNEALSSLMEVIGYTLEDFYYGKSLKDE